MFKKVGQIIARQRSTGEPLRLNLFGAGELVKVDQGNKTLGSVLYSRDGSSGGRVEFNKSGAKGSHRIPHLYVEDLGTENGNQEFADLGRGLMGAMVERSLREGYSGYVFLHALPVTTARVKRHPATFYAKVGLRPAFPINDSPGDTTNKAMEAKISQANDEGNPLNLDTGIYMELREGLGLDVKAVSDAQRRLPPEERNLWAVLDTAPNGTKAHRIAEIRRGRAILDEMRGLDENQLNLLD